LELFANNPQCFTLGIDGAVPVAQFGLTQVIRKPIN
jgi:hypothetical protein